jgi:pilus assembly protein Flp/PilA
MDYEVEFSKMSAIRQKSLQSGQGLVEYALILTLVAIVVVGVLVMVGPQVNNVFCNVTNSINGSPTTSCSSSSNNAPNANCSGNNGNGNGSGNCNSNGNNGNGNGN